MTFPLVPSPLGGNLGAFTASFFKLDPVAFVPIEPLLDLVPGLTPLRVTLDMIDDEQAVYEYDVTEHPVQSFDDVSSNVHKRPESITIVGTLGATPPLLPIINPPVPGSFLRLDLLRIRNLKAIADKKEPIMVVTPRVSLAKAFITSIQQHWSPADAESSRVAVTVREARLVSPLAATAVAPDYPAQTPGNNTAQGGGGGSTSTVDQSVTQSDVFGVPPTVGPAPP